MKKPIGKKRFQLPSEFTRKEHKFLQSLTTPQKIQAFLDEIPSNFEPEGDTVLSPIQVLRQRRAHCVEAAMFAALVLRLHGEEPFIVDLTANNKDQDHVITVFRRGVFWGAIAKSNHYCLGYRDAVYRSLRELVMSYFHEYLNTNGEKTLRSFSQPLNLQRFDHAHWMTSADNVWIVPDTLWRLKHTRLLTRNQERQLAKADVFTRDLNNVLRHKRLQK